MGKKLFFVILAVLTIALLVGCTSGGDVGKEKESTGATETTAAPQSDTTAPDADETTGSPSGAPTDESLTVTFRDGPSITLGAAADDVISTLGEPLDRAEAPSCVHPGNDVIYSYNGYTVTTQPDVDGKNIVTSVEVTSDAVTLENGVAVNGTVADAKAAFGEDFTEAFGQITYERGQLRIDMIGDGDLITTLAFTYTGDM